MDVLELDIRIEKDLMEFEKNLSKYKKLLEESKLLKEGYIRQVAELNASYTELRDRLNREFEQKNQLVESMIADINKIRQEIDILIKNIQIKISEMDKNLAMFKNEMITYLENIDKKIADKILNMEDENKRELLKIVNALSENEKEIVNSNTKVTQFISDEIYKVSHQIDLMVNTDKELNYELLTLKNETLNNMKKINKDLLDNYATLDSKYTNLNKKFKYSTYMFIVALIVVLLVGIGR